MIRIADEERTISNNKKNWRAPDDNFSFLISELTHFLLSVVPQVSVLILDTGLFLVLFFLFLLRTLAVINFFSCPLTLSKAFWTNIKDIYAHIHTRANKQKIDHLAKHATSQRIYASVGTTAFRYHRLPLVPPVGPWRYPVAGCDPEGRRK